MFSTRSPPPLPRFLLARPLLRALSWVGWGLNRVTLLGLQDSKSDMVYLQNLVRPLGNTTLSQEMKFWKIRRPKQ